MSNVAVAFIDGQGGAVTSPGMIMLCGWAAKNGFVAANFSYTQIQQADQWIRNHSADKTSIVCYSAGAGTGDYISWHERLDQVIALDPSRDCVNYKVKPTVPDSVLVHNDFWFTHFTGIGGAGEATDPGGDLGFKTRIEVSEDHLLVDVDPHVQDIVKQHLLRLKGGAQ